MRSKPSILSAAARIGRYLIRGAALLAFAQFMLVATLPAAIGKTNKLVGVVFDDSGSMGGRTNLPVFGIQMLAASLTRSDQLFGMTFKQFLSVNSGRVDPADLQNPARLRGYMTPFSLTDAAAQQRSINAIKRWAINPSVNTPFQPVLVMLAFLAQSATPDDDVHLFVFTDGEFNNPPNPAELGRVVSLLKQNSKAQNISIHFLAFVASDADEQKIRAQGIADVLDQTINTNKMQGAEHVFYARDFSRLRKQLVDIIARISETESEEAQAKSTIVKRSGSKFTVNAPVTVTKIIVISTAPEARDFPQLKSLPPGTPIDAELLAEMEAKDDPGKLRGTDGRLWKAKVTHLQPHPALPANKEFSIEFDRPLTEQTTLLFRNDMTIEWDVVDPNGVTLTPDADGTITLSADQDYEVRAHIEDKGGSGGPASFQNLPNETEFTLLRRDPSGRAQRSRMQIDKPNNRATSKLRYGEARNDEVSVSIVMPGFVTARSRAIKINVVRNNIDITLTPKPLVQCPGCSASKVELKLSASSPWTPVMGVTARATAREPGRDGKVTFALADPLPTGVRVQVPAANTILEANKTEFELPLSAANTVELVFEVDGNFLNTLPDGYKARLSAKALAPLAGSAGAVFDIRPRPEDAQLIFAGTTDGATGDTPFRVKPDGLDGKAGFYVRVLRPYGAPKQDDFKVSIGGLAADIVQQPAPRDDIALIKPRATAWCNCFVQSGRYEIDARFKNAKGQEASLSGAMFIEEVTLWERFLICLWLIILVLLALYLLWGIIRFFSSYRFPWRSRILVYPQGKRIDGVPKRLARRPWPWIKPFVVPFLRLDERCRAEGLSLEAGPGGIRLLPKGAGAYEQIRRGAEARPVASYFRDGNKEPLELFWGERLEELSGERRTFEFLESTDQI